MSYEPERGGWFKGAVGVGIAIVVAAAVGVVAREATREAVNFAQSSPAAIEADLDSYMEGDPSLRAMFHALRDHYPSDYERFISGLSRKIRNKESGREINLYSYNFMRNFSKTSKSDFIAAPQQDLVNVLRQYVRLTDALSRDSDLVCAQFVTTGLEPGQSLSDPALEALARAVSLQIKAAAAGRDSPSPRQAPTDADWQEVFVAMLEDGVTEMELATLADNSFSSLSVSRQCEVGKSLYRAMSSLPPEPSARMAAYVLIPD